MSHDQNPHALRSEAHSRRPIARLRRAFLTGLVAIIPLAVTAYVVYWLFATADSLFGGIGRALLPPGWYVPGLGLAVAVLTVLALGAALNASAFGQLMLAMSTRVLERIPLIKTVFSDVRDLMLFVSRPPSDDRRHVALVTLPGEIRLIGFITDTAPAQTIPELTLDGEAVLAVYLPMSYQIGGYTLYLPEHRLQRLAIPVEEAMRMVLTAGMNHLGTDNPAAPQRVTR